MVRSVPGYLVAMAVSSAARAARARLRLGAEAGSRRTCRVVPMICRSPARVNASRSSAQGSRHGAIVRAGSGAGFDLVAQDEISTGVAGLGGGEVLTQLGDGCCGAPGRQRVKADRQDTVAGVDVTAAGQRLTDQGVRFVVRAGVPGMDSDRSGQGGGCVERCDADAVADQLGLYGQDLLAGVDLAQRQPGRDAPCLLYTSDAADEEDSV